VTTWRRWRDHPEQSGLRQAVFQVHLVVGTIAAAWVLVMSVSGSAIVLRNEFPASVSLEWLVRLHGSLLAGSTGGVLNSVGAASLIVLALTGAVVWWPGRAHWRRSLTVDWRARFPRLNWDVHSAFGFWFLPFVLLWSASGLYLSQAQLFDVLYRFDPADRVVDRGLFLITQLHFGRFNRLTEAIWVLVGLVPAILAFTGVFICCRRIIFKKPSNPKNAVN
jgi:uncharacterized iron-regulated membrane protein